jgi:polyisoprenoid-binding protein YceI
VTTAQNSTQTSRTYAVDPAHTTAAFIVRHMMIAKVRGSFNAVSGSIELPATGNVPVRVEAVVETDSVDTREPQRDGHLKSPDFFHAEQFPQLTFRSTQIEGTEESFRVSGDLTIHGVTRPIVFEATFEGAGTDPWGSARLGYEAHAKISRKDFGMNFNQALETGGVLVGDEVRIELNVEAIAQKS